jgi:hypothetical protein
MTTDLRIQVAEACGWEISDFMQERSPVPYGWHGDLHPKEKFRYERPLPAYDTSWDAASELVERLAKEGWCTFITNNPKNGWQVEFSHSPSIPDGGAFADTLPEAICKAFLSVTRGGAKE